MKIKIGFAAMVLGYDKSLPYYLHQKQTIINAAACRVYYLHGFNEPPKASCTTQKLIDAIIFSAIKLNRRPRLISQYANPKHHPKRAKFNTSKMTILNFCIKPIATQQEQLG